MPHVAGGVLYGIGGAGATSLGVSSSCWSPAGEKPTVGHPLRYPDNFHADRAGGFDILGAAIGLALLSGLWPVGLAAIAAYLDRPLLRYAFAYLAGAFLAESAGSALVLVGLGATGFNRQRPTRSGWLYVGIGILILAFAAVLYVRSRRHPAKDRSDDKQDARIREGRVAVAFGLGLVMWLPSPTYLAALKEIQDIHSGWALTTVYAGIAVILVLWIVEIPIILFLLFREPARRYLDTANGLLKEHGAALLAGLTAVAGIGILVKGILQLA